MRDLARSGLFTPYTSLFNVTGQPAISLPVGFGDDGLPTAVQLVGKPLGEDMLLQVATQMEAANPGRTSGPELSRPQDVGHPRAADAEPLGVGGPRAVNIVAARSWASSQVTNDVGPASASSAQQRAGAGERHRQRRRRRRPRAGRAERSRDGSAPRGRPARIGRGRPAARRAPHQAVGGVVGPDRLRARDPATQQRHRGRQPEPLEPAQAPVAGRVHQRVRERGRVQAGRRHRALRERLRTVHARSWCATAPSGVSHTKRSAPARSAARSSRPAARPSISSIVARGWSRSPPPGARRRDAAQRVPPRRRVGQIADRELHADALGAQPARIAHEAAHGHCRRGEATQHGRSDQSGGTRQQKHAREPRIPP